MKRDWTSRTTLLLAAGILVVLNLIGLNVFARLDLTDDRVYSLSEASIELVENLDDPVTVTAFFTEDLPAPYSAYRRFLKDKLDDYRAYGGQNVQYRFVDPGEDEDLRDEAARYRIPPVQIQVVESDNVQLKNAYMGLAIEYGGEREVLPLIQDLSTLEYDITSAIRRLTRDELPTVGLLSGHGELGRPQMQTFVQELSRNYTVETVTVQDTALSTRPDVLLIVSPSDSLPEPHLRALDAYVMQGGRMGVLLNAVRANLQQGQAAVQPVGLDRLLTAYGATVAPNLVMDRQSSPLTTQRQAGLFSVVQQIEYPFLPIATRFNPENMMVNRLGDVRFYFVSTVDTAGVLPEGVSFTPLIYSTEQSRIQEGFFMIQPMMQEQMMGALEGGPYVLAAALTGPFPSAFDPGRRGEPSRIVLVGDGDLLNESLIGVVPGNIAFGLNMVDWLAQDDALLSIRAKSIEPRPLEPVPEGLRPWIKYGSMLTPVVLVILFGLFRWQQRRRRAAELVAA